MAESARGSFDPKESRGQEYRDGSTRAVRPRDAATLIIVNNDASQPKVLMGQRHANHKFMPNKFVFPGGRVDRADSRVRAAEELRPAVTRKLMTRMRGTPSENRARALALAAIRETFEETGLLVGKPGELAVKTRHEGWRNFLDRGIAPALGSIDFIARAITPPYRTRRFDTRFFIADAELIQGDIHDTADASGELLGLHWLTIADARDLDLPNITRMILDELDERLNLTTAKQKERAVPFVHFRRGQPVRDKI